MAKYIEDFYYGNLDSQACSTKQNKTVQKTNGGVDAGRGLSDRV